MRKPMHVVRGLRDDLRRLRCGPMTCNPESGALTTTGPPTAAILLIGNELLSGKIQDENGHFLATRLRARGIQLLEVCVVPDHTRHIGEALLRLLRKAPILFTSGGVGPTHDDVTLQAVGLATGCPLVPNTEMQALLRAHYNDHASPEAMSMADLPRGTVLRATPGWPVLRLDPDPHALDLRPGARIYMLPGIPGLFRSKIEALEALPDELPRGPEWQIEVLETTVDETALAAQLAEVVDHFSQVEVGSYPRWVPQQDGSRRMEVRITFESRFPEQALAARDAMQDQLDSGYPGPRRDRLSLT